MKGTRDMRVKILSILMAVLMVVGMVGCGESKKDDDSDRDDVKVEKEEKTKKSKKKVNAPLEEIIEADFDSLLIQIDGHILRQGGYMTVKELVEECGEDFDFFYEDGPYEERRDYLLDSNGYDIMQMIPKKSDTATYVQVRIKNMTSEDEKIPLDEGRVIYFARGFMEKNEKCDTPKMWQVKGIAGCDFSYPYETEYDTNNDVYMRTDLIKELQEKGYTEGSLSILSAYDYIKKINTYDEKLEIITREEQGKVAVVEMDSISFLVLGEENDLGKRPLFQYQAMFDHNTDKLLYMTGSLLTMLDATEVE